MKDNVPRSDRLALPISLTYRSPGDEHWLQSRVVNMSDSGILFGPTMLEPGATVELIVSAPVPVGSMAPGMRVCTGKVVRTNEVGVTAVRIEGCRLLIEH